MKKRIGSFCISQEFLENIKEKYLFDFFSNFIVLEAQFRQQRNAVEYVAISNLFEEIERPHVPPQYYINIQKDFKNGNLILKYSAQKIDVVNFNLKDQRKYIHQFNKETEMEPLPKSENNPQTQFYPALRGF